MVDYNFFPGPKEKEMAMLSEKSFVLFDSFSTVQLSLFATLIHHFVSMLCWMRLAWLC